MRSRLTKSASMILSFGLVLGAGCKRAHNSAPASADAATVIEILKNGFPEKLSDTQLFEGGDPKKPNSDLVTFEVKVPLWSDGASKYRFMLLPKGQKLTIDAESGEFVFPAGATLVKHFTTPGDSPVPIETRVMFLTSDGTWQFTTYVFDENGVATANTRPRKVTKQDLDYRIPSEKECKACHETDSTRVRGFQPGQLNMTVKDGANQLDDLAYLFDSSVNVSDLKANVVLPDPRDESLSIDTRARAYMAVNCSTCHNPQGAEGANVLDFRWKSTNNHLVEQGLLVPGDLDKSEIWKRVSADSDRMPIIVQRADQQALDLIKAYVLQYPQK